VETVETPGTSHLLFVWSTAGYELFEREGAPPQPGLVVTEDGRRFRVMKVAGSPLPGDARQCAFLQPV
jgi:hypothetical protein